ncbi:MAG: peptide-methionine (R)-S-oxide reductase [Candidatus Pelagibacter sp.]|nr:peptide-methionine (R)-S-oxide reductase [Candidatus Pelagibacter sp.]|tara:strand:+ start:106 stop:504 length:399 start_codon:yes stop_codon:yes gene_type:complete
MDKIKKSATEWKNLLDEKTYNITRKSGTELPFTGKYVNEKSNGIYCCACCNNELFSSSTKFDSGTGWPSFFEVINNENILKINDRSHGMNRIEVLCSICDAHLGHLFDDGPQQTRQRYCINSLSLKLFKSEK